MKCAPGLLAYYCIGLRVYRRSSRHCSARRHKRSASPTYRYRPHVQPTCAQPSTAATVAEHRCEETHRPFVAKPPAAGSGRSSAAGGPIARMGRPPLPPPNVRSTADRGLHSHLLLVTGQTYHEIIGECSTAARALDLSDLDSMLPGPAVGEPGDFVLVQVGTGWRLDVRLLDVLVDRLGNLSVYVDKKYHSKTMTKHCRNIGPRCTLLANLVPVLEQFEPGGGGGGVMYDPDWIPVPALPPLPRDFNGSTDQQIEHLTWRLCIRDRRRNLYYRLDEDVSPAVLRYARNPRAGSARSSVVGATIDPRLRSLRKPPFPPPPFILHSDPA